MNESTLIAVGDLVQVGSDRVGTVAFIGATQFAQGEWIGVALDTPNGKNDGSVNGMRYFDCQPLHGIFTRRANIRSLANNPASSIHQLTTASSESDRRDPPYDLQSEVGSTSHFQSPSSFELGDRVQLSGGRVGTLRFTGPTEFAAGLWAGIELDDPSGKNDGSVEGNRPKHGVFSSLSKLKPYTGQSPINQSLTKTPQHKRSQESLLSYTSNLSSVSKAYRSNYGQTSTGSTQPRYATPGGRRSVTSARTPASSAGDKQANLTALQTMIKDQERHISRLLQEREADRSDLVQVTRERELARHEVVGQRSQIEVLNQQLESMQAILQNLRDEHDQVKVQLYEEKKKLEDLQFQLVEEEANEGKRGGGKRDGRDQTPSDDVRLFELEEALASAREVNKSVEDELESARDELKQLKTPSKPEDASTVGQEAESGQSEEFSQIVADLRYKLDESQKQLTIELEKQRSVLELDTSEQVNRLTGQVDDLSNQLSTITNNYETLQSQFTSVEQTLKCEVEALKTCLEQEKATKDAVTAGWKEQIETLEAKLVEQQNSQPKEPSEQHLVEMRLLEEKLKVAELKVIEYQTSAISNAEECTQTLLEADSQTKNETERDELLKESADLKAQLMELTKERDSLQSASSVQPNSSLSEMQSSLALVRQSLAEAEQQRELLEKELQDVSVKRNGMITQLSSILSPFCDVSSADDTEIVDRLNSTLAALRKEVTRVEGERDELDSQLNRINDEQAELQKELAVYKLPSDKIDVDQSNVAATVDMDALQAKCSDLESSLNSQLEMLQQKGDQLKSVQTQLDNTLKERNQLQQAHQEAVSALEVEKHMLLDQIKKAEKVVNSKDNNADDLNSSKSSHLDSFIDDHGSNASQIKFLNSIIVDLNAKNAELTERVRSMLVNANVHNNNTGLLSKQGVIPRPRRLWCDECLVFDAHDTEDCPSSGGLSAHNNGKPLRPLKLTDSLQPPSRVYCDVCGLFDDHETENCQDVQSF